MVKRRNLEVGYHTQFFILRYYSCTHLDELRKTMFYSSQDNVSSPIFESGKLGMKVTLIIVAITWSKVRERRESTRKSSMVEEKMKKTIKKNK
jgi:hypothetical protein